MIFIKRANFWSKVTEAARRLYAAEKELVTHGLTLVVLVALIGSAAYVDVRLQPKTARASSVSAEAARGEQAERQSTPRPPEAQASPDAAVNAAPAQQPAPAPDPAAPPALTQGTANLNPELVRRFDAFRSFIFVKYHVVLEIRSGYRSYEEQANLFRTLPAGRANPPGKSNHEKGEAIDYTNYTPEYNQFLGTFGLKAPFPGKEDWHIERVEVPAVN